MAAINPEHSTIKVLFLHLHQRLTEDLGKEEGQKALASAIQEVMADMNLDGAANTNDVQLERVARQIYEFVKPLRLSDGNIHRIYQMLVPFFE